MKVRYYQVDGFTMDGVKTTYMPALSIEDAIDAHRAEEGPFIKLQATRIARDEFAMIVEANCQQYNA